MAVLNPSAIGSSTIRPSLCSSPLSAVSKGPDTGVSLSSPFLKRVKEDLGDSEHISDLRTKCDDVAGTMGDNKDNLANDVEGDVDVIDDDGVSRVSDSELCKVSVLYWSTEEIVVGSREAGIDGGGIAVVDISGGLASVKIIRLWNL
jgi:hypothetical protein